ncbi:MAG: molecular chaperone HtpG [Clostridia bacterium]|nr:molecular chaperone HtpG [Clostridia bacterium]MDD4679733.1 molecular chaperone HtpG [Clostridia bacterium]
MIQESGNISVNTEDIFPIIKKWLYTDKDIFLRELISNGVDAITKHKRLVSLGEVKVDSQEPYFIKVILNKLEKTIQVIDNGIGMTAEEVKKYINQVAFSGAQEFLEKYKDQDESNQIIGHFGLGFYSVFMVAEKVEIDTLSYQEGAEAVKWVSDGGTSYEITASDHTARGSVMTLHIEEDSKEFLDKYELRKILEKYCAFLPIEIYLEDVEEEKKAREEAEAKAKEKEKKAKEKAEAKTEDDAEDEDLADEDIDEEEDSSPKPINDTHPLWLKRPSECTDEEYKAFYQKVFMDFQEPLFWIHLNVDYPFNLKGILYFPKLRRDFDNMEGQIKLYNNQVFVANNIREVIPEFLLLLRGVIDCPDLPLNVSRSSLQNDGKVRKISEHITKKVADKLNSLYKTEKENYEKFWEDINPFIKFGCMRDDKFYDRMKEILIYKSTSGEFTLLKDYLNRNSDQHRDQVFYISDEKQQAQYIRLFKNNDLEALYLDSIIDSHFISFLEMKETGIKFSSVDSDISQALKEEPDTSEEGKSVQDALESMFQEALDRKELKFQVEALKSSDVPAVILLSEQSRRMQEMTKRFGDMSMGGYPVEETLVLNRKNDLIARLGELKGRADRKEDVDMICRHVYDLAMLNHKPLEPGEMEEFVRRSNHLLTRLAEVDD